MNEDDIFQFLCQICHGYEELERNSMIHRDIKPENIMIHDGQYKLADFGFTLEAEDHL